MGPNPGADPLQNVSTTIATLIAFPFNTIELGTILHVMSLEELVHPSCTVPVVPGMAFSTNPNTALPPGVVFTLEELPEATPIVTGEFVPVPVSVTVCGLPAALSTMFNVAVRVPIAVGVNDTLIVQLAPPARVPCSGLHIA
jgi:hypothetical protein